VSCWHTHQENGSVERKHRHIVEIGLSLLSHASMPLQYWDETFLTTTYLINHMPSKVIQNDTPYHHNINEEPNYNFLRIFGCTCWPHLRPYNSHKLQFCSTKYVFWAIVPFTKDTNVLILPLEEFSGVIFDEVFPFSYLHPNVGPKLGAEIALHTTLFPTVNLGCQQNDGHMVNFPNDTNQICSSSQ
jgi:hypothetical protein